MKDNATSSASTGRRAFLVSDHAALYKAIELALYSRFGLEVKGFTLDAAGQQKNAPGEGALDIIIVAMSSPASEPLVAVARASLTAHIGRVPLLIISSRPFQSNPEERITHLYFPFDMDALYDRVRRVLQEKEQGT